MSFKSFMSFSFDDNGQADKGRRFLVSQSSSVLVAVLSLSSILSRRIPLLREETEAL